MIDRVVSKHRKEISALGDPINGESYGLDYTFSLISSGLPLISSSNALRRL
jgi:hypothetical protein